MSINRFFSLLRFSFLVALLAISQHPVHSKRLAVPLIIAGTTLFSGSIFALLLFKGKMGSLTKVVGPSTPVGGLLMIGGYLSLVSLPRIILLRARQINELELLDFTEATKRLTFRFRHSLLAAAVIDSNIPVHKFSL